MKKRTVDLGNYVSSFLNFANIKECDLNHFLLVMIFL